MSKLLRYTCKVCAARFARSVKVLDRTQLKANRTDVRVHHLATSAISDPSFPPPSFALAQSQCATTPSTSPTMAVGTHSPSLNHTWYHAAIGTAPAVPNTH